MAGKGTWTRGRLLALAGVIVAAAAATALFWWWQRPTRATRVQPLDPVADLGLREQKVPSSGEYTFVYVVEQSPAALKAMPVFGDTPRLFTFNPQTKALYVTAKGGVPTDTRLIVGYEGLVGDFLLDAQFVPSSQPAVTFHLRPRSMYGLIVEPGAQPSQPPQPEELVRNEMRRLGPVTVEALGAGRVRVTWANETRELAPGETWVAPGGGSPPAEGRVAFINYGSWPLQSVTVLR